MSTSGQSLSIESSATCVQRNILKHCFDFATLKTFQQFPTVYRMKSKNSIEILL